MNTTKKAWINAIFLIVTLAINTLGAIGLINGLTQKEISDRYVTAITPSPSTFSIWSVIYSLLIISIIVLIVKKKDPYYERALDQLSTVFWISCLLNIGWIVLFSFIQVELSVLFILGFVLALAMLNKKLLDIRTGKRWLLPLSFGLYAGWLFIATVVNTAAALVKLEWNGFGIAQETWGIIILIVAIVLLAGVLWKIKNAVFPLPVAWAYLGINQFLKNQDLLEGDFATLRTVALAGMVVLIIFAAFQFYRNGFAVLPSASGKKPDQQAA
ncbi:MAG: tryptophan-rich sensory protein [Clostridiaceae bacterium]|jgi:hypothetical protein|nr:tryptophan-rich sensory protein [Clostridiaceae bacterium]